MGKAEFYDLQKFCASKGFELDYEFKRQRYVITKRGFYSVRQDIDAYALEKSCYRKELLVQIMQNLTRKIADHEYENYEQAGPDYYKDGMGYYHQREYLAQSAKIAHLTKMHEDAWRAKKEYISPIVRKPKNLRELLQGKVDVWLKDIEIPKRRIA